MKITNSKIYKPNVRRTDKFNFFSMYPDWNTYIDRLDERITILESTDPGSPDMYTPTSVLFADTDGSVTEDSQFTWTAAQGLILNKTGTALVVQGNTALTGVTSFSGSLSGIVNSSGFKVTVSDAQFTNGIVINGSTSFVGLGTNNTPDTRLHVASGGFSPSDILKAHDSGTIEFNKYNAATPTQTSANTGGAYTRASTIPFFSDEGIITESNSFLFNDSNNQLNLNNGSILIKNEFNSYYQDQWDSSQYMARDSGNILNDIYTSRGTLAVPTAVNTGVQQRERWFMHDGTGYTNRLTMEIYPKTVGAIDGAIVQWTRDHPSNNVFFTLNSADSSIRGNQYGTGLMDTTTLGKTASPYLALFATDGTIMEISEDKLIDQIITNRAYADNAAAITGGLISGQFYNNITTNTLVVLP